MPDIMQKDAHSPAAQPGNPDQGFGVLLRDEADAVPAPETDGVACDSLFQDQLRSAEALTFDLKKILVTSREALHREGVCEQIEVLERWMESYRKGLKAASKVSELGPHWLNDTRDRLRLALDELQRLESESPNTPTHDHARLAEELTAACRRIERVSREIDGLFAPAENGPAPAMGDAAHRAA